MGHVKVIQSGNLVEVFEYERYCLSRPRINKKKRLVDRTLFGFKTHKVYKHNVNRRLRSFQRLVQSNLDGSDCYFLSLTVYKNVSVSDGFIYFRQFGARLGRIFGNTVRYVGVPEFQKRGVIHFHVLVWGLPNFIENERDNRFLQGLWQRGFLDCIKTDGNEKIVGYLSKYMRKVLYDERFFQKRGYLYSRSCMRSVSLQTTTSIDYALEAWGIDLSTTDALHEKEFRTQWLGAGRYRLFKVNNDN